MLFLHGYLSDKESFINQINFFSKFYTVTAFDFSGFGKSDKIESAYSVDDYAQETYKIIKKAKLIKPNLIAHSFGGRVAIKLSSAYPDLFNKLVLTGSAGILPKRNLKYKLKVATYKVIKKFAPSFADKNFGSNEYKTLSPIMKESFKKIVNENLDEFSKKITNETLLVWGKEDNTTPSYMAKKLNQNIKNSTLIYLNGGHFCFIDSVNAFNIIVKEFLQ